jgi:L-fuconolactonase
MTEVIPGAGTVGVVRPYLEYPLEMFGAQRYLCGSDWRALTLAGIYSQWREAVLDAAAGLPAAEVEAVMQGNARALYRPRRLQSQPVDAETERAI